jgi:ABC-type uncharacterized transport system substrate-binding protein
MVSEKDQQQMKNIVKYLKDFGFAQNIKALYQNTNLSMSKLYQIMPMIVELHADEVSYDEKTKTWKYQQAVTSQIE